MSPRSFKKELRRHPSSVSGPSPGLAGNRQVCWSLSSMKSRESELSEMNDYAENAAVTYWPPEPHGIRGGLGHPILLHGP